MKSSLNIAFCGCGRIAHAHAEELKHLPGVTMYAYWNRPEEGELAAKMRAEYGGAYATDDLARLAADPAIDAVYICTLHNDRLRQLRAMAEAGKPVFMEKPLALPATVLREMRQVLQQQPILFQSGFKTRFNSLVIAARELLPVPEILHTHVYDALWPDNFLNDPLVGGGNLRSQGVYAADTLHILAGSRPVSVMAMAGNRRQPSGVEDTMCATFTFANGAIGSIDVADAGNGAGTVSKFFATMAGGDNALSLLQRFTRLEYQPTGASTPTVRTGEEDGFRRQSEAFFAAVRNNTTSPCDFTQGAIPSIMIDSALQSSRTGCRVEIDSEEWLAREE